MPKDKLKPIGRDRVIVRGYSPGARRFVVGTAFPDDRDSTGLALLETSDKGELNVHRVFPETVTGYTGHKDRNGTDMFIGDILHIDAMPGLHYIYSSEGDDIVLIPMSELLPEQQNGGSSLDTKKMRKIVMRLSDSELGDKVTDAIEVTGNVISQVVPRLLSEWEKSRKMTSPEFDQEYGDIFDEDDLEDYISDSLELDMVEDEDEAAKDEPTLVEDTDEPAREIRGLAMDMRTWVSGKCYARKDENGTDNFTIFNYDEHKVSPVIPDTIGLSTPFYDKNGERLFDGDILYIGGSDVVVIKDITGMGICIIPYNKYHTELSSDTRAWSQADYSKWKDNASQIEKVGDVHLGFYPEFMDRINTREIEYPYGLETIPDTKGLLKEADESADPIKSISKAIDSVVHGLDPDIKGFFYDDYNSLYNEVIVQGRWKLKSGNEIHVFYNINTQENAVHYGNYEPGHEFGKRHGMVSYSRKEFTSMVDALVNCVLADRDGDCDAVIEKAFRKPANLPAKIFCMNSGWTNRRILEEVFRNASTISQKMFHEEVLCKFEWEVLRMIEYRAYDCVGSWMHGRVACKNETENYLRIPAPDKKAGYQDEEFISSSLCENTFLTDSRGDYIYSCDIVDYEGKLYAVYMSDSVDPNDVLHLVDNDSGFSYIYCMEYDKLVSCIRDATGEKLRWTPVNPAEWIRKSDSITVVGNMMDMLQTNPKVCLNSDDFEHDPDPLPVVFPTDAILSTPESVSADFFEKKDRMLALSEDEILHVMDNFVDIDDDDAGWIEDCYEMSMERMPYVKQSTIFMTETAEMRLWWLDETAFTIMLGKYSSRTENLGVLKYGCDYREMIKNADAVMNTENYTNEIYYNLPFPAVDTHIKTLCDIMKNEICGLSFHAESPYDLKMWLISHGVKEEVLLNYQCRAVGMFGNWVHGHLSENSEMIIDSTGIGHPYVRESLAFNTYMTDAAGVFIYDRDIVGFNGTGELIFLLCGRPELVYRGTLVPASIGCSDSYLNEVTVERIERQGLYRCLYQSYSDGYVREDLSEVQWVPWDIDWIARNSSRLVVLGNTMTNNVEIDVF